MKCIQRQWSVWRVEQSAIQVHAFKWSEFIFQQISKRVNWVHKGAAAVAVATAAINFVCGRERCWYIVSCTNDCRFGVLRRPKTRPTTISGASNERQTQCDLRTDWQPRLMMMSVSTKRIANNESEYAVWIDLKDFVLRLRRAGIRMTAYITTDSNVMMAENEK